MSQLCKAIAAPAWTAWPICPWNNGAETILVVFLSSTQPEKGKIMNHVNSLLINDNGANTKQSFFDIVDENFDALNANFINQIHSKIEHVCYDQANDQWNPLRVIQEVNKLHSILGYETIEEWQNYTFECDSIFYSKPEVEQYFRKQCAHAVHAIFIEESNKRHALFGQILADNYGAVTAEFGMTEADGCLSQFVLDMDPDDLRDFARTIINIVAKRPLVANGYFSYEAWEEEIKKQWLN
jgi:hypothetical protein